jgi:hypothetical protein
MSDLLHLEEHTSCRHYVADHRCRFKYHEFDEGATPEFEGINHHFLAVILDGEQMSKVREVYFITTTIVY